MEGDLQRRVGQNLRAYREAQGISQEAFADQLGFHRTYMGGVERGERNLTLKSLERIAERAGIDPLELLAPPSNRSWTCWWSNSEARFILLAGSSLKRGVVVAQALPKLPPNEAVEPVGGRDQVCFDEVRGVLERHGALGRFGITLLHQHFDIAPDEVLVETVDVENRVLVTRPQKASTVASSIETSWRLDDPTGRQRCETICQPDRDWQGNPYHRRAHYATG
jgi:transcriptional regulator with XRE-family HTH domain